MSALVSASLFFLSFAPLWMSVIFIDVMSIADGTENAWTEIISVSIILICFLVCLIIMMLSLNPKDTSNAQPYVLTDVSEEKAITAEYLLSYILPLFAFDFTLWRQVMLFLVFFATLGFLCIRHNYYCVNIMLELLGYRFYRCKLENEDGVPISKLVISKQQLNGFRTHTIRLRKLNNEYTFCLEL